MKKLRKAWTLLNRDMDAIINEDPNVKAIGPRYITNPSIMADMCRYLSHPYDYTVEECRVLTEIDGESLFDLDTLQSGEFYDGCNYETADHFLHLYQQNMREASEEVIEE